MTEVALLAESEGSDFDSLVADAARWTETTSPAPLTDGQVDLLIDDDIFGE